METVARLSEAVSRHTVKLSFLHNIPTTLLVFPRTFIIAIHRAVLTLCVCVCYGRKHKTTHTEVTFNLFIVHLYNSF